MADVATVMPPRDTGLFLNVGSSRARDFSARGTHSTRCFYTCINRQPGLSRGGAGGERGREGGKRKGWGMLSQVYGKKRSQKPPVDDKRISMCLSHNVLSYRSRCVLSHTVFGCIIVLGPCER